MLKNSLINNYISNSPPKNKMAMPESKYCFFFFFFFYLYNIVTLKLNDKKKKGIIVI